MQKQRSGKFVATVFLLGMAIAVASVAFAGFLLMLLVGALHNEFGWLQPLAFWPSTGIMALIMAIGSLFRGGDDGGKA